MLFDIDSCKQKKKRQGWRRSRTLKKKKKKKKEKKKAKKKEKKAKKPKLGACDQNEFGKYGVVRESDYFRKRREFEAWCVEVKKLPAFTGSKRELMELFNEFAEDYNTATMPDDKYYDLERWELEEYERRKRGERKAGGEMTAFDDEAQVEAARRREREARDRANEEADARSAAARMGEGKRQELKDLEILRQKQQQAYKRGDLDTVRAVDRQLEAQKQDGWLQTGF